MQILQGPGPSNFAKWAVWLYSFTFYDVYAPKFT